MKQLNCEKVNPDNTYSFVIKHKFMNLLKVDKNILISFELNKNGFYFT